MLPRSGGFQSNIVLSSVEWRSLLSNLSEDKIDELLLILEEEVGMSKDIGMETDRKLTVNKTRYLQRLEKLKIRMENLNDKANG